MKKIFKILATYSLCAAVLISAGCGKTSNGGNTSDGGQSSIPIDSLLNERYSVAASATDGGQITASASEVKFGDTVNFTFTADAGYVLASVTINGNEVEIDGNAYSIAGAMRDYNVRAEFVKANVTVSFKGEGVTGIEDISVAYGKKIGTLPTPEAIVGKRFVGWSNSLGETVTNDTIVTTKSAKLELFAVWETIEVDKTLYQPFSVSTAYYDASATNYGVVWHTRTAPANSVVLVSEGNAVDVATARVIKAKTELWFKGEYISQAVVDELKFDTTYTVKFGDSSADVWSKEYTFTTREEVVESTEFFYISDTQETARIQDTTNLNNIEYLGDTYVSQVMREATARFPDADFIAHGGDIVNWGAESIAWEEMLGSIDEYLFNLPMMPVAGNHEDPMYYGFGRDIPHIVDKMFNIDGIYDEHSSAGIYYSFDYGPMHFVGLRSNDVYNDYDAGYITEEQLAWLVNDVNKANETGKWIVAMMHEGPINPRFDGETNTNTHTPTLSKQLMPVFDELNVDLLLFAHNHWMLNTYPLVWDETAEALPYTEATVRPSTTTVEKVLHDGVEVNKFVFAESVTNRGTVYHQASAAGHQLRGYFSYKNVPNLLADLKIYQAIASNAAGYLNPTTGADPDKAYPSYSYIEVSGNELTVRTYGVDVKGVVEETDNANLTQYGVYIDGFKLSK
ncbi:MAG: metallophosphoesterase family protein [Clostridia bacterium]|nr:metallophosphoesterase family protein [Clostridia bacterium]